MKVYPLRSIPDDIWNAARVRALEEKLSIRAVLIGLLRRYARGTIVPQINLDEQRAPSGQRPKGVPAVGPYYKGKRRGQPAPRPPVPLPEPTTGP